MKLNLKVLLKETVKWCSLGPYLKFLQITSYGAAANCHVKVLPHCDRASLFPNSQHKFSLWNLFLFAKLAAVVYVHCTLVVSLVSYSALRWGSAHVHYSAHAYLCRRCFWRNPFNLTVEPVDTCYFIKLFGRVENNWEI